MTGFAAVAETIAAATGCPFQIEESARCTGGCINSAAILKGKDGRAFFVKTNDHIDSPGMFAAEADALTAIAGTGTIRVPHYVTHGEEEGTAFLVLEQLSLSGRGNFAELGRSLARLHASTSENFGWHRDNFIGATPQKNGVERDWIAFFRDQRLAYQLGLAQRKGLTITGAQRLLDKLHSLFDSCHPVPSLLHGDLWRGNVGFLEPGGEPVVFDPACYYGDRECDLAFTEMFGGFPREFYAAYTTEWPLVEGYPLRKRLYNLYHELNHYTLFGGGYGEQARDTVAWLCSRL